MNPMRSRSPHQALDPAQRPSAEAALLDPYFAAHDGADRAHRTLASHATASATASAVPAAAGYGVAPPPASSCGVQEVEAARGDVETLLRLLLRAVPALGGLASS